MQKNMIYANIEEDEIKITVYTSKKTNQMNYLPILLSLSERK